MPVTENVTSVGPYMDALFCVAVEDASSTTDEAADCMALATVASNVTRTRWLLGLRLTAVDEDELP